MRSGSSAFDVRLDILEAIKASGLPYVVLQPPAYMENFLGPWTRDELAQHSTFAYPTLNTVTMQWLTIEDVGTFATYAFGHRELAPLNLKTAGPERLNGEAVAARFSAALERPIAFREMSAEEFGEKLEAVFPGMGQGAAQGYAHAYRYPEQFSSKVDVDAALKLTPVSLTPLTDWVRARREAFS